MRCSYVVVKHLFDHVKIYKVKKCEGLQKENIATFFDTSFIVSKYIFQVKETVWSCMQHSQRQSQLLNFANTIFYCYSVYIIQKYFSFEKKITWTTIS